MAVQRNIAMRDGITLEGPLLEQLWAAYQFTRYAAVVPRYETLGTHHDVLVHAGDHSVLYETTGQSQMSVAKVDRFSSDALQLADRLQRAGEPPLREAFLVSATLRSAWPEAARQSLETHRRNLERTAQIRLAAVEDYDVLLPLLESGVLGVRLIDSRVVFAGPEDYAIRYDSSRKQFVVGFAPLERASFCKLPHSFLPSHYWEQRYQAMLREKMKDELEGDPAWATWVYPYQFGLRWERAEDLRELWEQWVSSWRRAYLMRSEGNAFVVNITSKRGNESYTVHVFDNAELVTRERVSELKGQAHRVFWQLTEAKEYLKNEKAAVQLHSSSDTWSPLAWAEAREAYSREFYPGEPQRGMEVLLDLLNYCGLGFAYSRQNLITLAAPPQPAIRLTAQGLQKPA